ncbi:MAG TPA: hypothetical protein VGS41_00860 [Chthonomonadales bacterium]|nr:hypothetical protein [Chthonomonadales bacterium]
MKIRWTEHSLRLRIGPEELQTLQVGDAVRQELKHGEVVWAAEIAPSNGPTRLEPVSGALRIALGENDLAQLSLEETEGVYFRTGSTPAVRYYVEKDFACEHAAPEESDGGPAAAFIRKRSAERKSER